MEVVKMSNSSTIIANENAEPPAHPGEHLREDFLPEFGLDPAGLSERLEADGALIQDVLAEAASVSPELALRLSRLFGTTPAFWLNLQNRYDLFQAERAAGPSLERIKSINAA
jgi:antitoxin HigA-1